MKLNPSLTVISHSVGTSDIFCDISTGSLRPLVPIQRKLFKQLHSISHPGVRASNRLISSRLVWPGMSRDVGLWAKSCISCIQDLNSCSFYSLPYSSANPEIFLPSCGSCWSSHLVMVQYIFSPWLIELRDGQRSLVLHLSWVLCSCFHLYLDFKIWSSCSSHVGQRFSVHVFYLDWSLFYVRNFSLHYDLFSSSK